MTSTLSRRFCAVAILFLLSHQSAPYLEKISPATAGFDRAFRLEEHHAWGSHARRFAAHHIVMTA
jgi:hypothetical protein